MINKKGYSLVEIIVTLSIVGLMSTLSISFYKNLKTSSFINNDAYLLKTSIIKVQNMTLSGQSDVKFSENNNFGLYFSVNNNFFYTYKDDNLNNVFNGTEILENVKLSNSKINTVNSGSNMDLLFKSNGDVYLNGSKTSLNNINISLIYKSIIKNIYINSLTKTINIQ